MILPGFKRLNTKDFPDDQQKLVEQLGGSLNDAIQSIFEALSNKLTFDDNFVGSIKDVNVTVDSNGTPTVQTYLNAGISSPARGIIVIKADNLTNSSAYPTSAPFITWNTVASGIQLVNVSGLIPGNSYRLRVLTLG